VTDVVASGARGDIAAGRWWEGLATVAAATAGLGLFLVVMGAAIVWVRLEAAGLPGDVGLAVTPKSDLAALGFRKLLFPALVNGGIFFAVARWMDARRDRRDEALARGATVRPGRLERGRSWLMDPARKRRLIVLPLVPIAVLAALSSRPTCGSSGF
jgi:hypothetical protein